jgi:sn-glycerol 3-phosphate transport system permease protein
VADELADLAPAPRGSGGGWRSRYSARDTMMALVFLAPSLAIFIAFYYVPFAKMLDWGRYQSVRAGQSYRYVGTEQYSEILGGTEFREGLAHSVTFVLYTVPAGVVLGILLAVAAHRRLKGIKVFQAIFSSTIASSVAVSSVIFFYLFNSTIGRFPVNWVNDPDWSLFAAALPSIWQNLGLSFVIVLAGLQAVPDEIMEAARLDGYGPFRRLVRITLPLISPVLLFLFVVLVIFGFQAFAQIEIITRGGPAGSSETLVFKMFNERQNYGAGAVYGIGLFGVTMVVTAVQFAILERRVHYGN